MPMRFEMHSPSRTRRYNLDSIWFIGHFVFSSRPNFTVVELLFCRPDWYEDTQILNHEAQDFIDVLISILQGSMPAQCLADAVAAAAAAAGGSLSPTDRDSQQMPPDFFRCFFAERRLPFVETATFVLNSAMDSFQTSCILAGRVRSSGCAPIAGWEACRANLNNCSGEQMAQMIAFERDWLSTFAAAASAQRRRAARANASASGAFLYSCHNHVAGDVSVISA